jgi:hypothetical protein
MYDDFEGTVEGDITVPNSRKSQKSSNEPEFNTLDEPIRDTVVSVMLLLTFINKSKCMNVNYYVMKTFGAYGVEVQHQHS